MKYEYKCGNCKWHDSDMLICDIHPEYKEMLESDYCDDWTDDSKETDHEKPA